MCLFQLRFLIPFSYIENIENIKQQQLPNKYFNTYKHFTFNLYKISEFLAIFAEQCGA